jgi:subtilase family serine protease
MCIPSLASAQGKQIVLPFLDVEGKAQKNVNGLTPAQIKEAYDFDQISNQGDGQTIAIVDAFDDPNIEADLATFDNQFNLPACTKVNGCLTKAFSCKGVECPNSNPGSTDDATGTTDPNYGFWVLEIALDVEWAHAIAPKANILLVEVHATATGGASLNDLLGGVDVALKHNVKVVSMSWGGTEWSTEAADEDWHFVTNANVTFFASAGDSGHGVIYPAASPYVMSVGGTRLNIDPDGSYDSEKAWQGGGGGLSQYELEPIYQTAYPIPNDPQHVKGTPDVAYDAAPATGVAVFDSVPYAGSAGWIQVGGTSAGPPQWSGLIAIVNSLRANDKKPALTGSHGPLYQVVQDSDNDATYHDVSNGKDGTCGATCKAKPGYDFVTGLGTPKANLLIPALRKY